MTWTYTNDDMRGKLIRYLHNTGKTQKELAAQIGISTSYLSDIIKGKRPVPAELAAFLGYEKQTVFIKN